MYEQFFGLEEEPFRLTPDPSYLFLSHKHAEALAHLKLCLGESSGFVCITGEVGTGKTTLLRVFLADLGPNVSSAYTFVPPLTALELLRRVCREFKLPVDDQTQGELVDQLHAYLMAQHEAGRLCVLILDEAQALSIDLLEQIRLLLNLETDRHKLLRIVLVGQPQLRKLLLDPELAQLNQRITLRWHLGPLSRRETAAYVTHRLAVASRGRATHLFSAPAVRLLHSISGGVPRLINMVAHRALLAAFITREERVTRRFIAQAYREIQAVPLPGTLSTARKAAVAAAGLALGIGLVAVGAPQLDSFEARLSGMFHRRAAAPAVSAVVPAPRREDAQRIDDGGRGTAAVAAPLAPDPPPAEAVARAALPPAPAPAPFVSNDLTRLLASSNAESSALAATADILAAWGERPLVADEAHHPDDLASIAWRRGLQDVELTANRSMLRLLDLPAVIALRGPDASVPRWVALVALDAEHAVLSIDGVTSTVDAAELEQMWSGRAHVFWRDFDALGPVLARGARGVAVVRLQRLLRRANAFGGVETGSFDAATEAAVIVFQRDHQLDGDGRVGPLTRIVLYNAAGGYRPPTLAARAESPLA